jgi:hypothetical protein
MAKEKLSSIVGKIVDLLTPLTSEDRTRAISAARTILGETTPPPQERGRSGREHALGDDNGSDGTEVATNRQAKTWQRQNGLTSEQLAQVFHVADGVADVIATDIPGKDKKAQTLNAYVLTGVAKLIAAGETTFADKDARDLCTKAGCYDIKNHSATIKDRGNWFTGGKDKGWTLTAPGLKHGAGLIKTLTSGKDD